MTYPSRLSLMNAHLSPFISSSTVSPTFMVGASFFSGRAGGGGAPGSPPSSVIVRRCEGERCPRCDATRPCVPRVTTAPSGSRSTSARRASAALRLRRPEVLPVCCPIVPNFCLSQQLASRAFHFEAHARAAPAPSTRWIPTRTRGSPTRPARRLARSPPGHTSTRATRRTRTYVRGRRRTGGAKRCTRDTSATAGGPARRSSGWSARRRSPAPPRADAPRSRRGTYQPESA